MPAGPEREFVDPWRSVSGIEEVTLQTELLRELRAEHELFAKRPKVIARRIDCDDVLTELSDGQFALVHLTWSKSTEVDPRWPTFRMFQSIEKWAQAGLATLKGFPKRKGRDYEQMERDALAELKKLENQRLARVLVQIVEPEFNAVYLVFANHTYQVFGPNCSDVIRVMEIDSAVEPGEEEYLRTIDFAPFSIFVGRLVVQARAIGTAMNGHGMELSFEGLPEQTMIIQSIYAGDKPDGMEDCMRLGIGNYWLTWPTQK